MWLRCAFYVVFSVFAAPFEAWSFFFNGLGLSDEKLISYPFTHGLLYVLAIILIAESIFRLVHHWELTKKSIVMQILLCLGAFVEFGIVFFYLMSERLRIISDKDLVDTTGHIQSILVLFALAIAWGSFAFIEWSEHRKKAAGE
jgi:hypothetical protein